MIEYEIRFSLPDNIANLFDERRRAAFVQKQMVEFVQRLVGDEVVFVAERELNRIEPTIGRVEPTP